MGDLTDAEVRSIVTYCSEEVRRQGRGPLQVAANIDGLLDGLNAGGSEATIYNPTRRITYHTFPLSVRVKEALTCIDLRETLEPVWAHVFMHPEDHCPTLLPEDTLAEVRVAIGDAAAGRFIDRAWVQPGPILSLSGVGNYG